MKINPLHLFLSLSVCFGLMAAPVHAQSTDDPAATYQQSLDQYRDDYSQYQIKLGAYNELKTFTAENDLIQAAQQMLLSRADVWITYWQLLSAKLHAFNEQNAYAVQKDEKQLDTEIAWLQDHKQRVTAANTRAALMTEATQLNNKGDTYSALAYNVNGTITSIALSEMGQTLLIFNNALADRVNQQQLEQTDKDARSRGLTVNAQRINTDLNKLIDIQSQYTQAIYGYASAASFTQITQSVDPIYTDLSQQFQNLGEISQGLEW